jgi:hypothetical protein
MEDEEQQQQEEEEQQQEGEEDDGMGSFYSSAADEEEEEEEDPPRRLGCQWVMRGEKWWEAHPSIRGMVFGQMISGAIAGCGMAAAALSDRGVNLPNTLNFLTYLGLCLYLLWLRRPLALSPWWYLGYAAVDVQANVLALLRCGVLLAYYPYSLFLLLLRQTNARIWNCNCLLLLLLLLP